MSEIAEEALLITPDGGVKKVMLQEGEGELPPIHARCLGECFLRNALQTDGDMFASHCCCCCCYL
jgi:hypothetical protein